MTDIFASIGDLSAAALLAAGLFALYKKWVVLGWQWSAKESECAKQGLALEKATEELVASKVAFAELNAKYQAALASLPSRRETSS